MKKGKKLYEGKAKIIYATSDKNLVIQYFKDDATAFNNQKKSTIEGKGVLNNIDFICNCTSFGHYQNPGNPLSEIKDCKENAIFFDAIYTPSDTEFLSQAKKYGFKTIGGVELFIFQGIESFLIFTKRNELKEKLINSSKQFISKYQNLS